MLLQISSCHNYVIMTITVLKFVTDCTAELLCHNLPIVLQDFLTAQQQT